MPVNEDALYEEYTEAFNNGRDDFAWEEKLENFKSKLTLKNIVMGAAAAATVVALLVGMVKFSSMQSENFREGMRRYETSIVQQQSDEVDRIYEAYQVDLSYDENFSRDYVKRIYNNYIDQGYSAKSAARYTERDLQAKPEKDEWKRIMDGVDEAAERRREEEERKYAEWQALPPDQKYAGYIRRLCRRGCRRR